MLVVHKIIGFDLNNISIILVIILILNNEYHSHHVMCMEFKTANSLFLLKNCAAADFRYARDTNVKILYQNFPILFGRRVVIWSCLALTVVFFASFWLTLWRWFLVIFPLMNYYSDGAFYVKLSPYVSFFVASSVLRNVWCSDTYSWFGTTAAFISWTSSVLIL